MKKYKLGLICGRFCHIHNGHKMLIDKSIEDCEKTLVLVGSAQEEGTLRNPFSADYRIELIKKIYPDNEIRIEKLDDLTNEHDISYEWGQYVIDKTKEYEKDFADLIISGNDSSRKGWFSEEQLKNTEELLINREELPISATELRGYLIIKDKEKWSKFVPEEIQQDFNKIREELLKTKVYQEILDKMGNDLTIENFTKIYNKYKDEDRRMKLRNI